MGDIRDDSDIKKLVHTFYDKVQKDERLGYIFNDYADVDWDKHLPNMVDFWSKLLFQTSRYKGRPFRQHLPLPIEKVDFDRWYNLFKETVDQYFEGEKAEHAKEMAGKIASSFSIRMEMEGKFKKHGTLKMDKTDQTDERKVEIAEAVRKACIEAARDGFRDASMSGLCTEGAIETAIGAMQSIDVEAIVGKAKQAER